MREKRLPEKERDGKRMGRKGLEESHSLANTIGGFSNLRLSRYTRRFSPQWSPLFNWADQSRIRVYIYIQLARSHPVVRHPCVLSAHRRHGISVSLKYLAVTKSKFQVYKEKESGTRETRESSPACGDASLAHLVGLFDGERHTNTRREQVRGRTFLIIFLPSMI